MIEIVVFVLSILCMLGWFAAFALLMTAHKYLRHFQAVAPVGVVAKVARDGAGFRRVVIVSDDPVSGTVLVRTTDDTAYNGVGFTFTVPRGLLYPQ